MRVFLHSVWVWCVLVAFLFVGLPWVFLLVLFCRRETTWAVCQRIYRTVFRLIGVRVTVRGMEHIEPGKAYVVAGNHVNFLDPFALCVALPKPTVGFEKRENFKVPIYGPLMKLWGNLPISRTDTEQAKRDLAAAREVLSKGDRWVLLFPEGTRTRTGAVGPFKKGAFHLARQVGVDIVPFTNVGGFEMHRTDTWAWRPVDIEIVLHPPISPARYSEEELPALIEAVRNAVVEGTASNPS